MKESDPISMPVSVSILNRTGAQMKLFEWSNCYPASSKAAKLTLTKNKAMVLMVDGPYLMACYFASVISDG